MSQEHITCPNCGIQIDIDDVLTHQAEERVRKEIQGQIAEQHEKLNAKEKALKEAEQQMAAYKAKEKELFNEKLEQELKKNLSEKEELLKKKLQQETKEASAAELKALKEILDQEKEKNKELGLAKVELLKMQNLLSEQKEKHAFETEKKLLAAKEQIELEARKRETEKWELKEKELLKKLEDQKKLTEEMTRKQEQGSMQLQGEVQELAIEEYLQRSFIVDEIIEIKKGARGGDCMQIVNNTLGVFCGKIYYESKRTKDFQPAWIEKFKDDVRDHKADIGVIVTQAMPKDMDRFGMKNGIWICTFDEFKGLCYALREGLIRISEVKHSQDNKGDKMSMLYDYFTSTAFKDTFNGMMSVFNGMQTDLEKEKRAMNGIWKSREKQIERFLINAQNMYGNIKGISGNYTDFLDDLTNLGLPE